MSEVKSSGMMTYLKKINKIEGAAQDMLQGTVLISAYVGLQFAFAYLGSAVHASVSTFKVNPLWSKNPEII